MLIIGSVAFDDIETPFGKAKKALGGSATYFSLSASYFGTPSVVAVVGNDFKNKNLEIFQKKLIDISGLEKTAGKTFRWGGRYNFDLNNRETLFTHLNVFEKFSPKLHESHKNSQYVFLGNIHPGVQKKVLKQLKTPKLIGLDTMNYWIEKNRPELTGLLKKIDVFVINDSEARELSHEHNLFKAAKKILKMMTPKNSLLLIKRGEYGLLMFQGNKFFHLPAFPIEDVVDPTGAGDTFAGGFMGYLAKTKDHSWQNLKRACVFGSVMASFCVEKLGTGQLEKLNSQRISKRFAEFKHFTHFA